MKLFYRVVCGLLIIPVLALTSGCASYRFGRLPSPYMGDQPNAVTQNDVSVAIKIMSCSEGLAVFDCEMCKRKINPVFIIIENKSGNTYSFRKGDIDSSYLPSEEVFKKCARSTMGRLAPYGLLALCPFTWIVFIPMFISEVINCPSINSRMRSDYTSSEIADSTIGPGRSISGVMFVAPFKSGELFTVPLVNKETGERVLFQFQNSQLGAVFAGQENKEKSETKEKVEPKKNFGP